MNALLHRILPGAGGVLLFVIAGLGAAECVPELRRRRLFTRVGYAYPLGLGVVSAVAWLLSHAFSIPLRRPLFIGIVLTALAAGICARLRADDRMPSRRPLVHRSGFPVLLVTALFAGFVCLTVFGDAFVNPVTDWDGRMTWCAQARYIRAAGSVDAPALRERQWYVAHPQYPLLLPLAQVGVQEVLGAGDDDRAIRPLYAAFLPAFLLVLFDQSRRRFGLGAACGTVLTASFIPFLTIGKDGGPGGCYSDFPLACFLGIGLVLLLGRRPDATTGVAAGVFLALAVLTKNEGLPLCLLGLAGSLVVIRRRFVAGLGPRAVALLPVLGAVLLLSSWKSGIPNRWDENYVAAITLKGLFGGLIDRFPRIVRLCASQMARRETWGGFWLAAPVIVLLAGRTRRALSVRPLVLALAGALVFYVCVYAMSPWDLDILTPVTWNRFLVQLSLGWLLVLSSSLREPMAALGRLLSTREHVPVGP